MTIKPVSKTYGIKHFIKIKYLIALVLVVVSTACGKYAKPRPPEDFAPSEVKELSVTASVQGVSFNWRAPTTDARGKDLHELEGYRIYRRELDSNARLLDPYAKFDLITQIEDTHLKELLELKKQASDQGLISRKVSLPEERSKFGYLDSSVLSGKRYLYQIIPINQNGVEGKVIERIDISFRGEISQVTRLPYSAEDFEF